MPIQSTIKAGCDAIDAARAELAAIRASQSDELNAAQDRLAEATVRLHAAEMRVRICRRLGQDPTLELLAVEQAQAGVSHASDLLVEVLDAAAGRIAHEAVQVGRCA